ncbi:flagellar filament capping protein FliD [Aquitalea denitrificans]|uniref:flagellar filament capping protein FliD n=1 Tax=Aquitalea denitrificans TaxID=519081 RepID=UPI001359C4F6|nr:flagellar filament capping protein FliD [Aquitalea denitrificans]
MASITTSVGTLDVQSIVSQLMTIEQQPLQASQQRSSKYNTQLSSIGQISSALSALQSSASKMSTGAFLQQFKASSTDTSIASVATTTGGVAGSYALNVTQLAKSRQLVFDRVGSSAVTDPKATLSGAPTSLTLTVAGKDTVINLTPSATDTVSLQSISDRINQSGAGVNASVVQNNGEYKLVLASSNSGSDNAFTIKAGGTDSGSTSGSTLAGLSQSITAAGESTAASDALLTVNGVSVSSGSNHLTNVISGANVDITKLGQSTITMTSDSSGIATSLQGFVDAYNQVKSAVDSARSGSLKANASVLAIQQKLTSILSTQIPGVDATTSYAYLAQAGISIQKDGTLKLDQTAFNKALSANPTAVANLFGNASSTGFGDRLSSAVNDLLGPNGVIETSKTSINSLITSETSLQTSLSAKLSARQTMYTQQYTALNAVLSKMQQSTSNLANLLA